jgi:hypothetical protein
MTRSDWGNAQKLIDIMEEALQVSLNITHYVLIVTKLILHLHYNVSATFCFKIKFDTE